MRTEVRVGMVVLGLAGMGIGVKLVQDTKPDYEQIGVQREVIQVKKNELALSIKRPTQDVINVSVQKLSTRSATSNRITVACTPEVETRFSDIAEACKVQREVSESEAQYQALLRDSGVLSLEEDLKREETEANHKSNRAAIAITVGFVVALGGLGGGSAMRKTQMSTVS